ncbi:hypothetical protein GCM10023063_04450 [Arthrobacter methylotrophus]|uniref:VOC family protein n=1 Tax=Arthrobacter methylotrophus TaxID=121291 RepID=A0ABV5USV2_9MICC
MPEKTTTVRPPLTGLHNARIPVSDLDRSLAWYQDVFGFEVESEFIEHGVRTGFSIMHPSGARIILRTDPAMAAATKGFDPVALAVKDRAALALWAKHLTNLNIEHPEVYQGHLGWVIPHIKDPDGIEIRLYTEERPDTLPDYR